MKQRIIMLSLVFGVFSCSTAVLNLKDRDALLAYLQSTHFSCDVQDFGKKEARDKGSQMQLRFSVAQRETASGLTESIQHVAIKFFDAQGREKDASSMRFQIEGMAENEGRRIELTEASSSFSHMVLTDTGEILLYLAQKEWEKAGVHSLRFHPVGREANTVELDRDNGPQRTPSSSEGSDLYDRARFEEVFIGKPESFVRERLGEPANWDLTGPFYKDGEQVFRKVVRYDRLVYEGDPGQVIPSVILKYDKDHGGNVTRVEYKY